MNIQSFISNKRVLLLAAGALVAAVAVITYGTGAFFSDTETSANNTFTAGSIDLALGSQFSSAANGSGAFALQADNEDRALFNFTDLKPGDFGTVVFDLQVTSNDSYVCALSSFDGTPDNGIVDSEGDAGDVTDGPNGGELQNHLQFATFDDEDENGAYTPGEPLNVNQFGGGDGNGFTAAEITAAGWVSVADNNAPSNWLVQGSLATGDLERAGMLYCFGDFDANGACTVDPLADHNEAQTDGISGGIEFFAVQMRNNDGFVCTDLAETEGEEVNQSDLETASAIAAKGNDKWFFYNDTNDTVMTINQFGAGSNEMASVAGEEGAKMTLADGSSRYNIATYRYNDVKLTDIGTLKFRIYDSTADSDTPYLHFNVDFNNSDTWQSRLVMFPTGIAQNTWTTVDAINGGAALWTYSGAFWPAGGSETGTTPGTTAKTWASILADYPLAETRSSDSFLGVRVGQPGPAGATGYVDSIEFDGQVSDFEI